MAGGIPPLDTSCNLKVREFCRAVSRPRLASLNSLQVLYFNQIIDDVPGTTLQVHGVHLQLLPPPMPAIACFGTLVKGPRA